MSRTIIPLVLLASLLLNACNVATSLGANATAAALTPTLAEAPQSNSTTTALGSFTPAIPITATAVADVTLLPTPSPLGPVDCPDLPSGGFLKVWQSDPDLKSSLGCPTSYHPRINPMAWDIKTSYQPFERGVMIWSDHIGWYAQPVIYAVYADSTYQRFNDTFDPAVDSVSGDEAAPRGMIEPILGFGKVWREQIGVRESLGWATAGEVPGVGKFQIFIHGDMIWIEQTGQTYVFSEDVVRVFDVPFTGK